MGVERRIPVKDERIVHIPFEEYRNLLLTSLRVDILHDMVAAGEYVTAKDIRYIFGFEKKENEE